MPDPVEYLGMTVVRSEADTVNNEYFAYCASHEFHLQSCAACNLLRYPPSPACCWCSSPESKWVPVEGRGTVHSYCEIVHAVQPGFRLHVPFLALLVELDTQKDQPAGDVSLRMVGNYVTTDGVLAPPELLERIGIGSRVRMVFTDIAPDMSLPQWTLDEAAVQPAPWRYPD